MSRVYEALRQSEIERGVTPTFLDPDSFVPGITQVQPVIAEAPNEELPWAEIGSFEPKFIPESRLVAFADDNSLGAEKFRLLRARLRNLQEKQSLRKLVITSAVPGEGKTLVSMNLAVTLAKHTSQKVLLLEGDLRKPMLGEHLGMHNLRGLNNWFGEKEPIYKSLHRVDNYQLWILPAGRACENPMEILQSARFLEAYNRLAACFDWVLIDAPPLLPMADVNFWSRQADGILLVTREGKTPRKILEKGLGNLDSPKLIGIVLNDAQAVERSYYHHYYYGKRRTPPGTTNHVGG